MRWLYDDHADALLAYAERFTHDRMAAEDAVQETFLRAWSNLPRGLADERSPRPWLRTVLRHVLVDAARPPGAAGGRGDRAMDERRAINDPAPSKSRRTRCRLPACDCPGPRSGSSALPLAPTVRAALELSLS